MEKKQIDTEIGLPLGEYYKRCDERMDKARVLVKERIQGTRKGLPNELNYLHSFRVMEMVDSNHHWDDPDYDLFTAALLHDIVEDGGVSFEELESMGFTARTIELIRLCSHRMDVKDSTQRWMLMIAKLIEAKDEDAWRIKLADLADNLTQSRGLSPENRRFMIEVKAPLLLRLGYVNHSAWSKLKDEMEKQRAELAKQWRYIVTQWTEDLDIDGFMYDFAVLGNFEDRSEAFASTVTATEVFVRTKLDVKADWDPVVRDEASREPLSKPNKFNKVIFSRSVSRWKAPGFDSLRVFIEVIEVPYDTVVGEQLFNLKECGNEISRFFDKSTKEEKDNLFNLNRGLMNPTQCHLWDKEELTASDLDDAFDVLQTYTDDSHFSRRLVKCKQCGQLYLKEFYEEIDWIDGEDPQYVTYIPVKSEQEAEAINQVGLFEFQTFAPRINRDWPKGKPKKIYWIGR